MIKNTAQKNLQATSTSNPKRVILLLRNSSYRGKAFYEAAKELDIEIVVGVDMHPDLADYWNAPLGVQFDQPDEAAQTIMEFAQKKPVQAILAIDDSAALVAAT